MGCSGSYHFCPSLLMALRWIPSAPGDFSGPQTLNLIALTCLQLKTLGKVQELVTDGVGEGGLLSLCSASSLCPFFRSCLHSSHNDLISSAAIFELCTTSDLVWTQLCLCSSEIAGAPNLTRGRRCNLESASHPRLLLVLCLC